jgi:hypothetical protein
MQAILSSFNLLQLLFFDPGDGGDGADQQEEENKNKNNKKNLVEE